MVIKTLMKSIREYKTSSILTPLFMILEVSMECVIPMIMAELIDQMYDGQMSQIIKYGLILILMATFSLIGGTLSGKFCATASSGFAKNLRSDLYLKVQSFSFANIDKFSSASLVTRLTTDVTNVQNAYMMIIRIAVRCPLMLIFSLIMSFSINAKLACIFLVSLPILIVAFYFIFKIVTPIFHRVFKKYDAMNESVQENIKGMRVVKSYVREDYEKNKFRNVSESVEKDFVKAEKILALINPIMMFSIYFVIMLISILGSIIIIKTSEYTGGAIIFGELSTGELSSLITYTTQILSSLMMLNMVVVMVTMSKESASRICEILQEDSTITNVKDPVYEVKNGDVEFDNVSFKYSEKASRNALDGINLTIKTGELVGIIGGTGSSKTTLIQLISRLYDATEGVVKVGDLDVKLYDLTSLRDAVSVVLQKNVLFSGTIFENIRWGNKDASDEEVISACKAAQAHEFVSSFPNGYNTYIEQGGSNVSGGQKQRLCIARALLKKPKVLILDDSTSAVDTKTDALIRQSLRSEIPNTTKIIIAQRISSIQDADKIIVMDNGKIVAIGTHDELLNNCSIYQEVYYSQNKVGGENE